MRLERLEVGGFGRLAELEVDFHPRLTVILGENESGKSTVHRALRAALYGIDAGGPGRPTERSDWARWTPWSGGTYSVALTYELAGGRRLRAARRLEQREHTCQVHEIGGGDVTGEARIGRAVLPGQVHLGVDEAVFCASACLGDDGLRLSSSETPAARASDVQEAIERLADTGDAITAAQALAAIAEAMARVGSERRPTSPLGTAVNRLRQLDVHLDEARRRLWSLAAEEERLRALELEVGAAERRRRDAERSWLLGRLSSIAAQRGDLEAASAEMTQLAAEVEGTAHLAAFPLESEERVILLAAELQESRRSAAEAEARASAATLQLADVRRRRAEIGAGLRALAGTADVDDQAGAEATEIERGLAETLAGRRRGDELAAAAGRREALRREIAATGIAGTSGTAVDTAIELVAIARGGRSSRVAMLAATLALIAGAVVVAQAAASGNRVAALIAGAVALAATAVILVVDRLVAGDAEHARRRLARLCPGVAMDAEGLDRLAERLPRLRALYAELQREELRLETLAAEVDQAELRLGELAARAAALAGRCGITTARVSGPASAAEATVRAVLEAVAGAAGIARRREELGGEDGLLEQRERDLDQVCGEAKARRHTAAATSGRLRRLLDGGGIDAALSTTEAVAGFRAGCAGRRRHEVALRRLRELRRRSSLGGDASSLGRLAAELEGQLVARGGDPGDVAATEPLDQSRLQELEMAVEHARQGAVAASTEAASLSARLGEMRRNVPSPADLEDERTACLAARDRGLQQLAALRQAAALIETATAAIHRELAPRLASSVAERLALLTEGRYRAVNVDTAHFEVSLLGDDRPDLVPLALLSHGTRDQVSLLLRLALAEVLSDGGEAVPLLLDEPLLSADPQRRATALRFLWNLSATNQVVMSTSDPAVARELAEICADDAPTVVSLGSAALPSFEMTGRSVARVRVL